MAVLSMKAPLALAADEACGEQLKAAMRLYASTVSIITTMAGDAPSGIVATAVTPICMDPPTLMICINKGSSIHPPIIERGQFTVNFLAPKDEYLIPIFSGKEKGRARFNHGEWDFSGDTPLLLGACANVSCDVVKRITYGTHELFFGVVTSVAARHSDEYLIWRNGGSAVHTHSPAKS